MTARAQRARIAAWRQFPHLEARDRLRVITELGHPLAKLRALDVIGVKGEDLENIRWKNAARIFPPGAFAGAIA